MPWAMRPPKRDWLCGFLVQVDRVGIQADSRIHQDIGLGDGLGERGVWPT